MKNNEEGLKGLEGLLLNREFGPKEREKRVKEIDTYLLNKGGIIIAASCKDGILLTGVNPSDEQAVFQVFHRIALLGKGRDRDCKDIHKLALALAWGTGINLSKADINVKDIARGIAEEIDKHFSYSISKRGPYKADFIIAELGFIPEEDFLNMIDVCGEVSFKEGAGANSLNIIESPTIYFEDKGGNIEKDVPHLRISQPVTAGLFVLMEELACSGGYIESVKEVALFVGLVLRLLNERGGKFEMVYLDREMLKKSKSEERRFHHIWQRITNPNPHKSSDPWQDWKKFVAPIYKKAKAGEMHPKLKLLIEFFEIVEKELNGNETLLKKLRREKIYLANLDFVLNLFGKIQENNKE